MTRSSNDNVFLTTMSSNSSKTTEVPHVLKYFGAGSFKLKIPLINYITLTFSPNVIPSLNNEMADKTDLAVQIAL